MKKILKNVLFQFAAVIISILIVAAIDTYIFSIKLGSSWVLIIWIASVVPILQSHLTNTRRLCAWFIGAFIGILGYLSEKSICSWLYSKGTLNIYQTADCAGYSIYVGVILALALSCMVIILNNKGVNILGEKLTHAQKPQKVK